MITRRQFLTGMVFSGAGLVSTDAFCYERFFTETKEFDIGNAAAGAAKIRILQISDLHLRNISWYHEALVEKVNSYKVDLIVFSKNLFFKTLGCSVEYSQLLRTPLLTYRNNHAPADR